MIDDLRNSIDRAIATEVELRELGNGETQILVPFYFPDGDGVVIHVRQVGDDRLEITDSGHTLLHLSYHTDLKRLGDGQRASLLEDIRGRHDLDDRGGEFFMRTSWARIGSDVLRFSQALLEISDLRNLDREIIRSTFKDDFNALITQHFPGAHKDFVDQERDRAGEYPIPFVLNNTSRPIAVYDVNTDERALEALVIARKMEEWKHRMLVVAIEEHQERLTRKHVAWLSSAMDKQFPALAGSEQDIVDYLSQAYEFSRRVTGAS